MAMITQYSNLLNNTIEVPDDVDPLRLQQAEQDMYLQQQQQQQAMQQSAGVGGSGGQGGGALGFLGNLVNTATDYASAPGMFYAPSVAGAYAMTPEGFNQHMTRMQGTLDRQQRSQIEQARQRMEMEKLLQDQKDADARLRYQEKMLDIQSRQFDLNKNTQEFNRRMKEEEALRGETFQGASGSIHNVTYGPDGTPTVRTLVEPTPPYYAPRYTPDGQVITYDPETRTSRAEPVEGYTPAQKPPKTVNITKDGETQTYYQYPDGKLTVVPLPEEGTTDAGQADRLSLQEISKNTGATSWLGNKNFTTFVNAARAEGYSDEEIASYAQQKGIADDNSNYPFYGGTNTNISNIPRKTETYEVPASNPTGAPVNAAPDALVAYEARKTQFLKDHPEIKLDFQGTEEEKAQAMMEFDRWYQDNVEPNPPALLPSGPPAPTQGTGKNSGYGGAYQEPKKGTYNGIEGVKVGNSFYPKEEWIRNGGSW